MFLHNQDPTPAESEIPEHLIVEGLAVDSDLDNDERRSFALKVFGVVFAMLGFTVAGVMGIWYVETLNLNSG